MWLFTSSQGFWLINQGFLKDLGKTLPRNTLRREAELATRICVCQLCEHGVGRPGQARERFLP